MLWRNMVENRTLGPSKRGAYVQVTLQPAWLQRGMNLMSTQARLTRKLGLGSCLKNVVPVVVRGPEALDGRMEGDHGAGHVLAGGIGVKATINEIALGDQGCQPARVGSSAGCRDAAVLGVESPATDGVDGRLDEDAGGYRATGEGEEAEIFLRTWG